MLISLVRVFGPSGFVEDYSTVIPSLLFEIAGNEKSTCEKHPSGISGIAPDSKLRFTFRRRVKAARPACIVPSQEQGVQSNQNGLQSSVL